MTTNQAVFPVQMMAKLMGVSRSGFYVWSRRAPSDRAVADAALTERTAKIHGASKETYGAPRIHAELADEGANVGRKRVERLWKSIKYEEVYLRAYETVSHARTSIGRYLNFYNARRPHSSLGRKTPDHAYFKQPLLAAA